MNRRAMLLSAPAMLAACASEPHTGGGGELRGKAAIAEYWKRYYRAPQAPFSWRPDRVAVLDSGTLAYSSGPVAAPDGKVFARFYSTWRRDASGAWRIVFDDGCNLGCA